MKRFGVVIGALAFLGFVTFFVGGVPSCSHLTPEQNAKLLKVADIGLKVGLQIAESKGVISPGDRLLIGETAAVLTSPAAKEVKLLELADIGISEAVKEGVLQPGDTVLIKDALEVIVTPPPSPPLVSVPDALASELAKPPAVDVESTGGK